MLNIYMNDIHNEGHLFLDNFIICNKRIECHYRSPSLFFRPGDHRSKCIPRVIFRCLTSKGYLPLYLTKVTGTPGLNGWQRMNYFYHLKLTDMVRHHLRSQLFTETLPSYGVLLQLWVHHHMFSI